MDDKTSHKTKETEHWWNPASWGIPRLIAMAAFVLVILIYLILFLCHSGSMTDRALDVLR